MELRLIARVLLRYWWLVLIPTAVAAVLVLPSLLDANTSSTIYRTVVRYSAAQQPTAQPPRDGDFQDIWLASELTVNALTAWVQTASFRQEIDSLLDGDIDLNTLSIAADNERSVGQIFLDYPNAEQLAVIADAAIEVLKTRNQAYFPQVGSAPADVTLLDDPVITPLPAPLPNRFAPFIRIGLGLIAGVGLAFLAFYLDPTLRQREELEALGLPVIATLPRE
jgi:capsular polysaccharide biosynthesis protein